MTDWIDLRELPGSLMQSHRELEVEPYRTRWEPRMSWSSLGRAINSRPHSAEDIAAQINEMAAKSREYIAGKWAVDINEAASHIRRLSLVHYSANAIRRNYEASTGGRFNIRIDSRPVDSFDFESGARISLQANHLECNVEGFYYQISHRVHAALMDYFGPDFYGFIWWLNKHGLTPYVYHGIIDWLRIADELTCFIQDESFSFSFPEVKIFPDNAMTPTPRGIEAVTPDYIEFYKQGRWKRVSYERINPGRSEYSLDSLCWALRQNFHAHELRVPVLGAFQRNGNDITVRHGGGNLRFTEVNRISTYFDESPFISATALAEFLNSIKPKPKYPLIPTKFLEGIEL